MSQYDEEQSFISQLFEIKPMSDNINPHKKVPLITGFIPDTEEPTSALDTQVGGSHYKSLGVQPMELVLKNMGFIAFEGACYTKINKYMIRHKDNKVEQLKKAAHILQMWIEEAENQQSM